MYIIIHMLQRLLRLSQMPNKVVEYLKQYGVDKNTYVWLDVEDACQKGLGQLLVGIINSYAEVIKSNGYKLGIYWTIILQ